MIDVGGQRLALPAGAVARILDPAVEGDFEHSQGSDRATWRGAQLPVVDLDATLGSGAGTARVFLLVESGHGRVIVPVDIALSIRDVPADAIAPLPPFIFAGSRRLVRGLFADDEGPRLLLDEGALG